MYTVIYRGDIKCYSTVVELWIFSTGSILSQPETSPPLKRTVLRRGYFPTSFRGSFGDRYLALIYYCG